MQASTQKIQSPSAIQTLLKTLSRAINLVEHKRGVQEELDEASLLLESLPLTTEEFSLANNRLWNAGRFVRSGECGAAHWELRTLRTFCLRQEADVVAKPRRARWTR